MLVATEDLLQVQKTMFTKKSTFKAKIDHFVTSCVDQLFNVDMKKVGYFSKLAKLFSSISKNDRVGPDGPDGYLAQIFGGHVFAASSIMQDLEIWTS